jgi:hypothetical protein
VRGEIFVEIFTSNLGRSNGQVWEKSGMYIKVWPGTI